MEPISEEEKRREAEFDTLRIKITEEDPGYFDRLADRIIAEADRVFVFRVFSRPFPLAQNRW